MFGSTIKVIKALSLAAGFVAAFASTSSANQFRVTEVALVAQPAAHNGACPATINFVGRIKASGRGRVAYRFLRSDGARGPVFTVDFDEAGEKEVSTTWRLGGPGLPFYRGWKAIRIVAPNVRLSNRAVFEVRCLRPLTVPTGPENPMLPPSPSVQSSSSQVDFSSMGSSRSVVPSAALAFRAVSLPFVAKSASAISSLSLLGRPANARPDLTVRLQAPHVAFAGQDISPLIRLFARNIGAAPAPGTNGVLNPANGYMIDLVLSRDGNTPAGFAVFSPNFAEDVLLRGGRTSNTADLAPGAARLYPGQGVIPGDTPTGNYFVCARIDPGNRVAESSELNNTSCVQIHINPRH